MKAEHLVKFTQSWMHQFPLNPAIQYYTCKLIAVIDGEFLLLLHRSHFWIIVKAASSECRGEQTNKNKQEVVNIFSFLLLC